MPDLGSRRRIAYVADTMANMQMLCGLAERFDVTLVVPAGLGRDATNFWPPPDGVPIDRVDLPGGRIRFVASAARWLRRHADGLEAAVVLDSLVGALAANLGRSLGGPPVVLQVGRPTLEYIRCRSQGGLEIGLRARHAMARALIAVNERRAAAIGTVSEYVAESCARRNGLVRAIPWQGIDLDRFAPTVPKAEARRILGLPEDGPVVMWRSRLAPEKDPDTFLLAIAQLRRDGVALHAVYMGGEMDEMAQRARHLGVDLIVGNANRPEEIPLWYVAADVTVQTSRAEGLGLSVVESLACGTPVVVSDVGGLPETVDGGRCGAVVPFADVPATAAAIRRYLDAPEVAAAAGEAGRRFAAEVYERSAAFDAWAGLVAAAAGGSPSAAATDEPRIGAGAEES